jgi:hypothetical protein
VSVIAGSAVACLRSVRVVAGVVAVGYSQAADSAAHQGPCSLVVAHASCGPVLR